MKARQDDTRLDAPEVRARPRLRRADLCLALAQAAFLVGCAGLPGGAREHMFLVKNVGDVAIRQVWIEYAKSRISVCEARCRAKQSDGGYGVNMPVQEQMTVQWQSADGQTHRVVVPVREKVKDFSRFRSLYLDFAGALRVIRQGLQRTTPGLAGLAGFDMYPLYP